MYYLNLSVFDVYFSEVRHGFDDESGGEEKKKKIEIEPEKEDGCLLR